MKHLIDKTSAFFTSIMVALMTLVVEPPRPAYVRNNRRGSGLIEFMILAGFAVVIFLVFRDPITAFIRRIVTNLTRLF